MQKILVKSNKYDAKYVALKSAEDNTIVGSGKPPKEALNKAKEKGISNPFILYVPDKDLVLIC